MRKHAILMFLILGFIITLGIASLNFAIGDENADVSPIANYTDEDSVITQTIKKSFKNDPRITSPSADVTTANGVVSLIGTFDDKPEVSAAIEDIIAASGAQDIDVSQVVLSTGIDPTFDDLVIESRIRGQYRRNQIFGADPITVVTVESRDGVVFLIGAVSDIAQRERAIDIASRVPKVKKVIPDIRIKY